MNLAAVLIPPSLDPKQALRLRRFGLAALTYALSTGLVAVGWAFGMMPASAALRIGGVFVVVNLALYSAIRSGFNLRFKDPSLTVFQILVAITVLMYVVYHLEDGRNIALFGCFVVFQFGIFRLSSREFTMITLYTLAGYALVQLLLMYFRPEAIHSVPREWMSWLLLAGFLPIFTIVGGQFNSLRRRLRTSEARFRGLTEMSSDIYWETDAEHRIAQGSADRRPSFFAKFQHSAQIGERIWEIPYLSPDEASWQAHRAVRDAHLAFRDFEYSRVGTDGAEHHISISGDPIFDSRGVFQGYRGVGTDITERRRSEQALRDTADKLRLFADNVPAMTVYWDKNQHCAFASKAFAEFYGLAVENIVGMHVREVLGDEGYRRIEGHLAQVLQGHPVNYQRIVTTPAGEPRHVEARLMPHIGEQGKVLGWFAVTIDITEHKLVEQALREGAETLRLFADNVPAMTAYWDENLRCRFTSKAYSEYFGIGDEDLTGKHVREVLGEAVYAECEHYFAQAIKGNTVTYQRSGKLKNGETGYLEIKLLPNMSEHGKFLGWFGLATDITEHKLAEQRMQRVAHHDGLTGLPNQTLFNDRLEQAISLAKRDSRQFALLYLDLDKFKPVNDALGHAAGDELLKAVAARIRRQVRESDTVARVGGDEFTVILADIGAREEADIVAGKITAALATPFQLGSLKHSVAIGASIGVAIYPRDGREADALVEAADAAMYNAKQKAVTGVTRWGS